jgi:hypothetical protein
LPWHAEEAAAEWAVVAEEEARWEAAAAEAWAVWVETTARISAARVLAEALQWAVAKELGLGEEAGKAAVRAIGQAEETVIGMAAVRAIGQAEETVIGMAAVRAIGQAEEMVIGMAAVRAIGQAEAAAIGMAATVRATEIMAGQDMAEAGMTEEIGMESGMAGMCATMEIGAFGAIPVTGVQEAL